jgi:hypothetical protein
VSTANVSGLRSGKNSPPPVRIPRAVSDEMVMSAESRKQDRERQICRARAVCHNDYLQFHSSTCERENRYANSP